MPTDMACRIPLWRSGSQRPRKHFSRTYSVQQDENGVFVLLKRFRPAEVLMQRMIKARW